MAGKNDLSNIKLSKEKILQPTMTDKNKINKETDSVTVSFRIKPSEFKNLEFNKKEKVGELVKMATFMSHYLRTETDLLE